MTQAIIDISDVHLRDIRFMVTRADGLVVDFSQLVVNFSWADHVNLAGATVNLSLVGNPTEVLKTGGEGSTGLITAPLVDVNTGQLVRTELWRGQFIDVVDERSDGMLERMITAYDILHNFAGDEEDYVFANPTLSGLVTQICKDFAVPRGTIAATSKTLGQIVARGESLWDIIQKAVQRHFNLTGEVFRVYAAHGKVHMRLQGDQDKYWSFEEGWSLSRLRRTRTIAEMINRVKIYGQFEGETEKPPVSSIQENTQSQSLYGRRQRVDYLPGGEDAGKVIDTAKQTIKMFSAPKEEIEITGWLVPNLRAGEMIRIRDIQMGINRLYYVESMESNWSAERAESIALAKREAVDPQIILDEIVVA